MDALKKAAKRAPRPFDCVVIDDTSRFGRNLGDVIKLAEFFQHYGVSLHFVSPPLDSSDPNFHQLLIFKGMMDEQYSIGLADKVRRGLEGRILKGYNAGAAEEWVCCENPKWRIVSDGLWEEVQKQRELRRHFGAARLGGLSRTSRSREYLFSLLISCGLCNRNMSITDGSNDDGRYGCAAHRYKGACSNALTIRRTSLESQVLHWLTRDLLQDDRLEQVLSGFYTKLQERVAELEAEARKNAINAPELRKELIQKKQEAWGLTDHIAAHGRESSPIIRERLATAEARIEQIEKLLARAQEPEMTTAFSMGDLKKYMVRRLMELQTVLTSSPEIGRQVIQKHIKKITLTPGEFDGNAVFHVAVEFVLGGGGNSAVVPQETVDAFSQQYGFSTITINGLVLDASRVRRKPVQPFPQSSNDGSPAPASINPAAALSTQGCDSESTEIAA